jgi:succinylarginine dihydrolase
VAAAATISPSADTGDGRLHATVANLQTMLHRILEGDQTERTLRRLLPDEARFAVHPALLPHDALSDEGAANQRMSADAGAPGVEIFVYGRKASEPKGQLSRAKRWKHARQLRAATRWIRRA